MQQGHVSISNGKNKQVPKPNKNNNKINQKIYKNHKAKTNQAKKTKTKKIKTTQNKIKRKNKPTHFVISYKHLI